MKKIKQPTYNLLIVALVAILVFGVMAVTFSKVSFTQLVAQFAGITYGNRLPLPEMGFNGEIGAVATTTVGWSAQPNIALDASYQGEVIRYDMGDRTANGVMFGYQAGDCTDATTTLFALQNTTGRTIYVNDAGFFVTGGINAATSWGIGTTSVAYVNRDTTFRTGAVTTDTEGKLSIFYNLTTAANIATGTSLWVEDNLPTDTRDNSGAYYNVAVLPGEYITGYATSTDVVEYGSVTSSVSFFACKYFFTWRTHDNATSAK